MRFSVALVCAMVVLAGCGSFSAERSPPANASGPTEAGVHPGSAAHLEVNVLPSESVRISIVELDGRSERIVHDENYSEQIVDFSDGELFREDTTYRVNISVNGTERWNETVNHYEGYELLVKHDGNVSVSSHWME